MSTADDDDNNDDNDDDNDDADDDQVPFHPFVCGVFGDGTRDRSTGRRHKLLTQMARLDAM